MSTAQGVAQVPSLASVQALVQIVLLVCMRAGADKVLVSTVPLVGMLQLQAALRARVARLDSSRHYPEAEAARRARQVSSKMNLHKHSVIHAPMVHSPVVPEALSVEYVP